MLYDISIGIDYAYDRPVTNGRNLLRLCPANLDEKQRLIASHLVLDPEPDERVERLDFFGNRVLDAAWRASHEEASFRLTARVLRLAASESLDIAPEPEMLAQEMAECRSIAPDSPHHLVGPSPRVALHPEMTAFARAYMRGGMSVLAIAQAVSEGLHEHMEFDAEATTVDTPALEAFASRKGVCQDFSHVMIACLRGVGIPAGYVSGLLRTVPPPGAQRLEGADAMHAWVRVWCGREMGWIEFDPTNAMRAGEDHIVIGYGRDYCDVAPVKGVLRSSGAQSSRQAVDVVPLVTKSD